MKIIFLDIDGVMNSMDEIQEIYNYNPNQYIEDADMPSPKHLKWLKKIVEETDARIVLSSSWRLSLRNVQKLIDLFEAYNLTIYGYTCDRVYGSELKHTEYEHIKPYHSHETNNDWQAPGGKGIIIDDRGAEIAYWLLCHKNVTNYVILDDDSADIENYHPENLVKTNYMTGLLEEHYKKAIKILNKN